MPPARNGADLFRGGVETIESPKVLPNIADARSVILHPASTTHRQLSEEERIAAGVGPEVVRMWVGIEDADDIIANLDQALEAAGRR